MATLQQACFLVISQVFSDNLPRRLSVTSSVIRCSLRRTLAAGFAVTDCVDRMPAIILGSRCCCCCCCEYPCLRRRRLAGRVSVNHRRTRKAVVDASIGGEYGERRIDSIATTTTAAVATTLAATTNEDGATVPTPLPLSLEEVQSRPLLGSWKPPRYLWRALAAFIIAGQVVIRSITGRVHVRNTLQQLELIGPRSLGVSLLTASFVGMVFTIQFVREFARLGLTRSVGGVLSLALARELSPVVTAIIMAGRVGSAFAAELGTMQVSEQTDTLRVLRTDPVDYLVTPRVIASCISLPILTVMCFSVAMAASVLLADAVYNVSSNIILESAARALQPWDLISTMIKSVVFGGIISVVSCTWGVTTLGGAKGVGESTTSAVVISLVCIFIADFILSWIFFQGAGDALKAAMG
ncbi:unnamed protein product [Sphagnum troendelagicum]|uniref:Trigalactosyldiacylglycerol 1 n=1 Tax=Sphagnum troendelagicum TaxID=128251 RepID=A0ABP0U9F4_9BRYO